MSSVGQAVGGIIGGVVGFVVGGPGGAAVGFQIGAGIGGVVDPPVVPGQKLGDLAQQTSKEGGSRAIVYGTCRPIGGNVIATTKPIIRKKRSGGGKGGGPKVESEEVYRTYAIGVCEGPITGFRRVWRDGKLVYFAGKPEFLQNNIKFLQMATFYLGDFDQLPDAALQAALGIDNVTPYRGTAYMVINNENLTANAGRIPAWTFEVVRSEGFVLTSRPYPVEVIEGIQQQGPVAVQPNATMHQDSVDQSGPQVLSGQLRQILLTYEDAEPESIDQSGPELVWGQLYESGTTILEYTDGLPESMDQSGPTVTGGTLESVLIEYENYPEESIDQSGPDIIGGSLA